MLYWCRAGLRAAAGASNSSLELGRWQSGPFLFQPLQEGAAPGVSHLPCLPGLRCVCWGPGQAAACTGWDLVCCESLWLMSVLASHASSPWTP